MRSLTVRISPWLAFASVVSFLASTGVRADSLHVTAADALSNNAYDLKFAPPATPPSAATKLGIIPLPASPVASVRSIVYVANEQTAKADLIAADNRNNNIVRYAGTFGPALPVWSAGSIPGPITPIALSADSFGNVYAGRGDVGSPELWVLKHNPDGSFSAPIFIDSAGFGSSNQTRIVDSLVIRTAIVNGPGAGDVLVLVNDGRVLRYTAASIASVLAGNTYTGTPDTLMPAGVFNQGHIATSIAIWPKDGSLLVPTVDGAVRRYSLATQPASALRNFATGLPTEATGIGQLLGLIRTYDSSSGTYAVLDNPQRNKIFELQELAGGCQNLAVVCNPPQATITTVSSPVGLAITDASTASSDCNINLNANGCSLLGGTVKVKINSTAQGGSVVAVSCTVDDPRFTPTFNGSSLLVSSVCPGYPDIYVPGYLAGAAGASGHAMAFLKFEEADGFAVAPSNLLVNVELSAEALVGAGAGIPLCPQLTMGWAPLDGEAVTGSYPEGSVMMEPTSWCGSTRSLPPGHSIMLVGAQIASSANLLTLADQKFDRLHDTISAANITTGKTALGNCADYGKTLLHASSLTSANQLACAAHQAYTCDSFVDSSTVFGANPDKLSALSAVKGRLENLVMHIDNRMRSTSTPPQPQTVDPMPSPADPVKICDIAAPPAPTGVTSAYVPSKDGKTLNVSWSPAVDPGQGNSTLPGPYASGIARYHVYLNGTEYQSGSPTTSTSLQITLTTTTSTQLFSVTVTADDKATGGNPPNVFNVSPQSSPLMVHCYDSKGNGNCTKYP